jgi:hypothetical protein
MGHVSEHWPLCRYLSAAHLRQHVSLKQSAQAVEHGLHLLSLVEKKLFVFKFIIF